MKAGALAPSETGATRAYAGYEYQLLVSLWVALVLLFEEECAEQIELEPASQEDIEAEFKVPSERAAAVRELPRRLILQVKRHSSAPWKVSEFEGVLKGQDSSGGDRKSALRRLIDEPGHRYVLITDGQLPQTLRGFRIENLLAEAPAPLLSTKVQLPAGVDRMALSRKIGILDQQHSDRLLARIHSLLSQRLFVPLTRVVACTDRLMEQARARLLNRAPRQWTRGEILRTAESFGGNPTPNAEVRAFVPPGNYADIQRKLEKSHAIVLRGPPGAGKTQVLEKLQHEYRTRKEPFDVRSARTPGELRELMRSPGLLFIAVEDPWGKFQRDSGADRWVDDLPSLLKLATGSADKRIVVTTREAILYALDKNAAETFQRFAVFLSYEHYDHEARRRILENKLVDALPWQRDLVIGFEQYILDTLLAPLSIDRFVDKVKGFERDGEFDLGGLLKASAVEHLAQHFVKEVRNLGWREVPVPAAIALWGLLSLSQVSTFSRKESDEWRRLLRGCSRTPIPWDNLINWMVAGRWLTHEAGQYRAHSTTLQGLESLLKDERGYAEEILEGLLASLVDAKRLDEAYSLLRHVPEGIIQAPATMHVAFREHFRSQLVAVVDRVRFQDVFDIASKLLHGDDHPVSLLVEGIAGSMHRVEGDWFQMGSFLPPVWTEEQKARVQASGEARKVAERYIEWVLPFQHHKCAGALASWLWGLGWDLTEDFQRAVRTGLEARGGADGLGEVVHGVLMSREPAHEGLLEALLRAWDVAVQADRDAHGAIRRKAQQKMLSELDADVWMEASDEIYVMTYALTAAVMERRHQQGYQWLLEHPRRKELLVHWRSSLTEQLPALVLSEPDEDEDDEDEQLGLVQRVPLERERARVKRARVQPVTVEELRAFYRCCMPDNGWALWDLVERYQVPELVPELLETLVAGRPDYLGKCLEALCAQAMENGFREQLDAALNRASSARRDAILFQSYLHDWASVAHSDSAAVVYEALEDMLSSPVVPAIAACRQVDEQGEPSAEALARLGPEDRRALREWSRETGFRLGRAALVVLAALGEDVTAEAQVALQSSDTQFRMVALKALGRSREPRARACLLRALEDEHYECRVLAIRGLTPEANDAERQAVIALARDESAPVLEACAQAIHSGRWAEGLQALCALLSDSRNRKYGEPDRNVDHYVARTAAKALSAFQPLPSEVTSPLLAFLRGGLTSNVDLQVHQQILQLLAPMPLPSLPEVLTELLKELARNPGEGPAALRLIGRAPGVNPNVIELRSLVVKNLFNHLLFQPKARETVDLEPLLSMSSHPRTSLAIPAWSGLALIGERAWSACRALLTAREEHFEEKAALLVFLSTKFGYPVHQGPIAEVIPEGSPIWTVAEWLELPFSALLPEWTSRWARAPAVLAWVKALTSQDDPWWKYVRSWLASQFGPPFLKSLSLPS